MIHVGRVLFNLIYSHRSGPLGAIPTLLPLTIIKLILHLMAIAQ